MKHSQYIGDSMVKDPVTISPEVPVLDAQEVMRSWGVRHLPVIENNEVVGVISDRDIYRAIAIKNTPQLLVKEAMDGKPYLVSANISLKEVAQNMAQNKYDCVLVKGLQGQVRGIFTTIDALYILSRLLDGPDDHFRTMNIEEYLAHHQKMAV